MVGSKVGGMEVRGVSGQERSWREGLYNRDSRDNLGDKG